MSEGLIGAVLGGVAGGGGWVAKQADGDLTQIRQQEMEKERFENQQIALKMGFDHADQQQDKMQQFQGEQGDLTRQQQRDLQESSQNFQGGENKLNRDQQLNIHKMSEAGQNARSGASLALQREALNKKDVKSAGDQMFGVYQSSQMIIAGIDPSTGKPIPANTPKEKKALAVYRAKASEQIKTLTPSLTEMGLLKTAKPAETLSTDQVRYKMANAKTDAEREKYQTMLGGY